MRNICLNKVNLPFSFLAKQTKSGGKYRSKIKIEFTREDPARKANIFRYSSNKYTLYFMVMSVPEGSHLQKPSPT